MREGGGVWLGGFGQANISFAGAGSAVVVGGWEEGSRSISPRECLVRGGGGVKFTAEGVVFCGQGWCIIYWALLYPGFCF